MAIGLPDQDGDTEPLQLSTQHPRPGVVVVEIAGELDLNTAPRVTDYLRVQRADHPGRHLVLDLTAVTFLASHGVAMMVTALNESPVSDRLHLVGVADNHRVRRVLEITRVAELFTDYPTVNEFLDALDDHG